MSAEIIDINERAREAWEAYLWAKERAETTQSFRDARAAGLAWSRFLDLFARPIREDADIITFRGHSA